MTSKTRHKIHQRSLAWVGIAALLLVLDKIVPDQAWTAGYYEGIYPVFRYVFGVLWGWSPLPMIYVLIGCILIRTFLWWRNRHKGWAFLISQAIGGMAFLVSLFYVMWAFNYHQPSRKQVTGANASAMTESMVYDEFVAASAELTAAAQALPEDLQSDETIAAKRIKDTALRPLVQASLKALDLPHRGIVRVRQLWPKGSLLHWSTAGIYIPQSGEGHVDAGLLSVQKPFTMTHEMAHGYGVTDEGDCNFIAWLSCRQSSDPWTRYCGAYTYWRYAAAEMPRDTVAAMLDSMPPVVTRSLELVRQNDKRYEDWMPRLRDAIYSNYLKRHGVSKGLRSYNEVVVLVSHYRKNPLAPF